jgi:hypothetical protein
MVLGTIVPLEDDRETLSQRRERLDLGEPLGRVAVVDERTPAQLPGFADDSQGPRVIGLSAEDVGLAGIKREMIGLEPDRLAKFDKRFVESQLVAP